MACWDRALNLSSLSAPWTVHDVTLLMVKREDEAIKLGAYRDEMASHAFSLSSQSFIVRKILSTCPLRDIILYPFLSVDNERLSDL